MKCNSIWKK